MGRHGFVVSVVLYLGKMLTLGVGVLGCLYGFIVKIKGK